MKEFIAKELLDELSYCSSLKGSLKQISLRKTPIELILEDIGVYRNSFVNIVAQENLIDYRFKSDDSIMQFIYTIRGIIKRIRLKYNYGASRITHLMYGAIVTFTSIRIRKSGKCYMTST